MHKFKISNCIVQVQPNWKNQRKVQFAVTNAKVYSKISKKIKKVQFTVKIQSPLKSCQEKILKDIKRAQKLDKVCRGKLCKQANSKSSFPIKWPLSESTVKNIKNSFNCTKRERDKGSRCRFSGEAEDTRKDIQKRTQFSKKTRRRKIYKKIIQNQHNLKSLILPQHTNQHMQIYHTVKLQT